MGFCAEGHMISSPTPRGVNTCSIVYNCLNRFQVSGSVKYFMDREQFKIIDLVYSPMFLLMMLPLLLFVMPKMMAGQGLEPLEVPRVIFTRI